jgi:glutaredoxin-like protein
LADFVTRDETPAPRPGTPIEFYWRPGCPFCGRLERSLTKLSIPFEKRNIWEDPEHAAYVRSVAGGNETVPTIRIGSTALVNPSARDVVSVAAAELPDLELPEPPAKGFLSSVLRIG